MEASIIKKINFKPHSGHISEDEIKDLINILSNKNIIEDDIVLIIIEFDYSKYIHCKYSLDKFEKDKLLNSAIEKVRQSNIDNKFQLLYSRMNDSEINNKSKNDCLII
jgi:hypothetical protein